MHSRPLVYFVFIFLNTLTNSQQKNLLNGKHLRVVVMEFPALLLVKRNDSGNVIGFDGVLMHHLVALSKMFNFSYSYVLPNESRAGEPIGKDEFYQLFNNGADYYLSTHIATASRLKQVDYPASFSSSPFGCIILYPEEKLNIQASLKPFAYDVWIMIVCTTLAIVLCLYSVKQIIHRGECKKLSTNPTSVKSTHNGTKQITGFVLGNLVSQGQRIFSSRLVIRIAAGAWCAGCFFLVQIYCSTLTSHLTASNKKPIADSVSELVNNPGISLTTDKDYALDALLKSAEGGNYKRLAEKFKRNPKLLCNITTECLNIVKNGNAAYGALIPSLNIIMENDLKSNGKCNYYLMKEKFLNTNAFTILRKNSPYTETISIGILRFHQSGFYVKWGQWYLPKTPKCMELRRQNKKIKLSLGHMSSAFVILFAGYVVSVSTFLIEKSIQFSKQIILHQLILLFTLYRTLIRVFIIELLYD